MENIVLHPLKYSKEWYKNCHSEYLLEKYPPNVFKFGIDIGCCGVNHPWHINHMAYNKSSNIYDWF